MPVSSRRKTNRTVRVSNVSTLLRRRPCRPERPGSTHKQGTRRRLLPRQGRALPLRELDSGGHGHDTPDPYGQAMAGKVQKIRAAQQAGELDPSWDPADICVLVSQIATAWIGLPEVASLGRPAATERAVAERRATVVRGVQALFPAVGGGLSDDLYEAGKP